ncbi:hypothetical protein INR49_019184 [Caranx melampygus]|nr:hypothetical protein INR49_019184 [Caranx melampygus]
MAEPELLLDSNIRLWVVLPIVFITFLVGVIRHYVSILLQSDKKLTLEQVSDSQVLIRSRILRENGNTFLNRDMYRVTMFLQSTALLSTVSCSLHNMHNVKALHLLKLNDSFFQSFLMRKFYFNNQEDGFFKKTKRKVVPPSPMTDPSMLTDMMKGNVTNVLPMILIGGWINWTFSGFVRCESRVNPTSCFLCPTAKVPFPLTLRFKPMLQQGIELLSLDASCFDSADQSRIMQEQMSGAAMAMPADTNKAFKAEWEALELTDHQWRWRGWRRI